MRLRWTLGSGVYRAVMNESVASRIRHRVDLWWPRETNFVNDLHIIWFQWEI